MAMGMLLWQISEIRDAYAQRRWPTIEGVVTSSRVVRSGENTFFPAVRYDYVVGGKTYTSEAYSLIPPSLSAEEADDILLRLRVGTKTPVRYKPSNPRRAVLVVGEVGVAGYAGVVVGLAMLAGSILTVAPAVAPTRGRRAGWSPG